MYKDNYRLTCTFLVITFCKILISTCVHYSGYAILIHKYFLFYVYAVYYTVTQLNLFLLYFNALNLFKNYTS